MCSLHLSESLLQKRRIGPGRKKGVAFRRVPFESHQFVSTLDSNWFLMRMYEIGGQAQLGQNKAARMPGQLAAMFLVDKQPAAINYLLGSSKRVLFGAFDIQFHYDLGVPS